MDEGVRSFIKAAAGHYGLKGKDVLEVGSHDVNGSTRPDLLALEPKSYLGVDIAPGPGVDLVTSVHDLTASFGERAFDAVVSTEMLEHVEDWRSAVNQMKAVLRPHGGIFLTTRHWGFPYHGYPHDYWRFEVIDLQDIFSDFIIAWAMAGPAKGAFIYAVKPLDYAPLDLGRLQMRPIGNYGRW